MFNVNLNGDISRVSGSIGCNQFIGVLDVDEVDMVFSDKGLVEFFFIDKFIFIKKVCVFVLMK